MTTLITIIHILASLILVVVVLLQTGKGAEIGATFGGAGSQTLFGAAGGGGFLSKLTVYAAVTFMLTSMGLTYLQSQGRVDSIMEQMPQAPVEAPAAATEESLPPEGAPLEDMPNEMPSDVTGLNEGARP